MLPPGHSIPTSTKSGSSTNAVTDGHALLPDVANDRDTFAFRSYSNVACDTEGGEFRWEETPPKARGTAKRDRHTGEITYERKTLADDHPGREIWETDDVKNSHSHMGATLRKQTTADGSRFRYVQTFHFIENGSIRREKNEYPSYAKELLVGPWMDNPSFHSTSNSSCAEKDNNPPISPPDAKEWMMVDPRTSKEWMMVDTGTEQNENKDWEEVPGSTWAVVHHTGSSAIDRS